MTPVAPLQLAHIRQRLTVEHADLSNSVFTDVNLASATFDDINLSGVTLHNVNLSNLHITDANTTGMTIEGVLVSDLLAAYRATHS